MTLDEVIMSFPEDFNRTVLQVKRFLFTDPKKEVTEEKRNMQERLLSIFNKYVKEGKGDEYEAVKSFKIKVADKSETTASVDKACVIEVVFSDGRKKQVVVSSDTTELLKEADQIAHLYSGIKDTTKSDIPTITYRETIEVTYYEKHAPSLEVSASKEREYLPLESLKAESPDEEKINIKAFEELNPEECESENLLADAFSDLLLDYSIAVDLPLVPAGKKKKPARDKAHLCAIFLKSLLDLKEKSTEIRITKGNATFKLHEKMIYLLREFNLSKEPINKEDFVETVKAIPSFIIGLYKLINTTEKDAFENQFKSVIEDAFSQIPTSNFTKDLKKIWRFYNERITNGWGLDEESIIEGEIKEMLEDFWDHSLHQMFFDSPEIKMLLPYYLSGEWKDGEPTYLCLPHFTERELRKAEELINYCMQDVALKKAINNYFGFS